MNAREAFDKARHQRQGGIIERMIAEAVERGETSCLVPYSLAQEASGWLAAMGYAIAVDPEHVSGKGWMERVTWDHAGDESPCDPVSL